MAINDYKKLEEEKDLVKVRDMINNYGGEKYGIRDNMIGWNQREGGGGTVQINGQDFMGMEANQIKEGRSYGKEDDIRYAIDDYAKRNNLSPLSVDNAMEEANTNDNAIGSLQTGYEDPYSEKIDKYLQTILNREKFDFDLDNSESYNALEQQYEIKGDLAMEDVMGAASQMTGGRTNSWSETVAAQAKNRFNDELLGKIPALEQAAYQQYMGENQMNQQALNALLGVSDQQYGRFNNERNFDRGVLESDRNFNRSILESDRNFDFQSDQAEQAAERWQEEFDYGVSRDQIMDDRWLNQFDYQKKQDAISNAYRNRQISLSEANLALSRANQNRNTTNEEIGEYMNYAINQLEAGKEEGEIKDYLNNLNERGDISDETLREVINRFPSMPAGGGEEPESNVVSVGYRDMMSAGNPQDWLIQNAAVFTNSELKELERMLPDDNEEMKAILNSIINN